MTRRRRWTGLIALVLVAIVGGIQFSMHGCAEHGRLTGTLRPTEERSQALMAMAAEEAAMIGDVDARLTRQLNLADTQIQRDWHADARTTLAAARKTLSSDDAKRLNDQARLSGWVSVSELSRLADDEAGGLSACDSAVAALRAIEDPAIRCDYVMGIANELMYLKGNPAAAGLLNDAAPWTKSIDDIPARRQAVVSFAAALFNLDDYPAGQRMLRQEDDAVWRADTLTRLASMPVNSDSSARAAMAPAGAQAELQQDQPFYGKKLKYNDVFKGQKSSQTSGK